MNPYVQQLLESYKSKITYVGMQSDVISETKRILAGHSPDHEYLFAVEGIWAHEKLLQTDIDIRSFVICPEFIYSDEAAGMVEALIERVANVYVVSKKVFEKLSERDKPDGVLSVGRLPSNDTDTYKLNDNAVVVVLDGLETPGNIGTILRTSDGAGVDAVLICNKRSRLTHPKLIKGSMGAAFVVPMMEFDDVHDCIKWLQARNFQVYLADTRAVNTYKGYGYEGNTALIMGSERYGISKEWYENDPNLLSIPMLGVCDSLNVGTAASIIIYEICMKKEKDLASKS